MRLLSLLPLLLTAPATAQELVYSDDATLACLASAEGTAAKSDCAGASAIACIESTPGGTSTFLGVECLDSEFDLWDQRLNDVYGKALAKAKKIDADSLTDGYGQSFMEETLVELQKAWSTYSAARCTFEEAQYRGGTGGSPAQLRCNMRTMAEQAAYLEENWIAP